jgi:hypothetical protein
VSRALDRPIVCSAEALEQALVCSEQKALDQLKQASDDWTKERSLKRRRIMVSETDVVTRNNTKGMSENRTTTKNNQSDITESKKPKDRKRFTELILFTEDLVRKKCMNS